MGIEQNKNGTFTISYCKRHPITRQPISLRRIGVKSKAEANRVHAELAIKVEDKIRVTVECKWGELTEEWCRAAESNNIFAAKLSGRAIDDYKTLLNCHTSDWHDKFALDISKADAWTLLNKVETSISKTRAKKLRTTIDGVFNWAILSGKLNKLTSLPTEGFKWTTKQEEKLPEILTREQIKQLLHRARQLDHSWFPIWALALYTGMRSGELYGLMWEHIDFENKLINVHRNWTNKSGIGPTKGRNWRTVPIESGEVLSLLKSLKLKSNGAPNVLPHLQSWTDGRQAEILREFLSNCGLPSIRFHALRACFATQLLRDSVAPAVVMKICGWKDLKTMQHYIRVAGVEVMGATTSLKFMSEEAAMGRVVELING